ncbi:MAG: hypothetical protein ACPGTS_01855 [Minisyncoccia bacterium]
MNIEIIPACMPQRFDDIAGVAQSVRHNVRTIQLDLMDGKYVPEPTWPFMYETDYLLEDLKKEDNGFPLWEDVNYELDLMVQKPEDNLETWLTIGASRVIFHYASVANWQPIKNIDPVMRNFVEIGIAITIHDDLEQIYPLIDNQHVDFVQVMGIAQIGYMGEPFDEQSLGIIQVLREKYPDMIIAVDGGVSENTIPDLRDAGATRFVSGSGVFGHGVAGENVEYLRDIAEGREE